MKTDKLFYRLFSVQPELLLNLAGMSAPYPKGYRQQSLELKETGFRLDGPVRRSATCYIYPIPTCRTPVSTRRCLPKGASRERSKGESRGDSKGELKKGVLWFCAY
jgi:predicted transposase YdaD